MISARGVVVSCKRLAYPNTQEPTVVQKRGTGDLELSHFQLPVRYDAHGSGPERERAYGRLSSSCMTVLIGMERQAS